MTNYSLSGYLKREENTHRIFYISLLVTLAAKILSKTSWPGGSIMEYIAIIGLFLISFRYYSILNTLKGKYLLLLLTSVPVVFIICCNVLDKTYILYPYMFAVCSWKMDFKRILKYYFLINLIILIPTTLASSAGLIKNFVFFRDGINVIDMAATGMAKVRQCFGYNYPTAYAAHVFYLVVMLFVLRSGVFKWYDYFGIGLSSFIVYEYCDARLDTLTIIIVAVFSLFYTFFKNRRFLFTNNFFLKYSIIFISLFMIGLTFLYMFVQNDILELTNIALSGRLALGADALQDFGVKILGQEYVQIAYDDPLRYNFIDCSYVMLLVIYGLIFFIFAICCHVAVCKKSINNKDYVLPLSVIIVAIHCAVVSDLMTFAFNPFYLGAFANINSFKKL